MTCTRLHTHASAHTAIYTWTCVFTHKHELKKTKETCSVVKINWNVNCLVQLTNETPGMNINL